MINIRYSVTRKTAKEDQTITAEGQFGSVAEGFAFLRGEFITCNLLNADSDVSPLAPAPGVSAEAPATGTRTRRTKAQIEADKLAAATPAAPAPVATFQAPAAAPAAPMTPQPPAPPVAVIQPPAPPPPPVAAPVTNEADANSAGWANAIEGVRENFRMSRPDQADNAYMAAVQAVCGGHVATPDMAKAYLMTRSSETLSKIYADITARVGSFVQAA